LHKNRQVENRLYVRLLEQISKVSTEGESSCYTNLFCDFKLEEWGSKKNANLFDLGAIFYKRPKKIYDIILSGEINLC
jgi:hypothetical protein